MSDSPSSIRERIRGSTVDNTAAAGTVDAGALGLTAGIIWGAVIAFLELAAGTNYGER